MFVLLDFHFVSLSVYRGCWRMHVAPVIAQHTTSNGIALYYLLLLPTTVAAFVVVFSTELVSLGRRISADVDE